MKAIIAIDSFKGSLSSLQAGEAVREGILRVCKDAAVQVRPLADGGEGTVEALTIGMGGELRTVTVTGPLGEKADAQYGILDDGVTAIVEMSAAAGITMVPDGKRNPLYTTTYGVGEMIRDAIRKGCRRFIVGIGGSATNDGGVGMLQALGYGMLDENGRQVSFGAQGLQMLKSITDDKVIPELRDCSFRIACDVRNPLYTTTYGVGEMICDAVRKGCRHFIVGIGGSATNDGGIGMLQALGYGMLDENGRQGSFGAQGLQELKSITDDKVIPELKDCSFRIACDVTNPLCGETGCSAIYGPPRRYRGIPGPPWGCRACRSLQPQGGPGIPRYRRGGRSGLCLPELHKRGARIRYQHRAR